MKKIKILGLIVTLIIVLFSCEEEKDPAGLRGVAVIPTITDINPAIFDSKDLENSYIEYYHLMLHKNLELRWVIFITAKFSPLRP